MDYAIADLHGYYYKLEAMLEKIKFSDSDRLFILGDLCDRGFENVEMLKFVMSKQNITCLRGNHDNYLLNFLTTGDVSEEWIANGGRTTHKEFCFVDDEFKESVIKFIEAMPYCYKYNDDNLLCHAGFSNPYEYRFTDLDDLICTVGRNFLTTRPGKFGYNRTILPIRIIVGHTPVYTVWGGDKIYRHGNTTFIDCGVARPCGVMACLNLSTGEEYYIK